MQRGRWAAVGVAFLACSIALTTPGGISGAAHPDVLDVGGAPAWREATTWASPAPRLTRYRIQWSRETRRRALGSALATTSKPGTAVVGVAAGLDADRLATDYAVTIDGREATLRALQVEGTGRALAQLARAVGVDSRIRYVEPLMQYQLSHARDDPATTLIDPNSGVAYEWAFSHVGVDKALNLTRGDPNILVGVVDSGWAQIPELSGKVAHAWYYTVQAGDSFDTEGHGTFVSSIIAAPNDDGHGLAGFCGACRLDVFKDLALTQFTTAGAIRRLVDDHVRVINLSLGSPGPVSFAMADALRYAIQNGVLVVASSGNEGVGLVGAPAWFLQPANGALGYGLAVGASDRNDNRASFSNWGANLSLVAPGTFDGGCNFGIWAALPATASDFDSGSGCNSNFIDRQTGER